MLARLPSHARVAAGGRRLDRPGYFHQATVVADVRQDDEIVQEEIFGPVITVQPFESEAEDHGRAERLCRGLDFGAVSVNTHAPMTSEMPTAASAVPDTVRIFDVRL